MCIWCRDRENNFGCEIHLMLSQFGSNDYTYLTMKWNVGNENKLKCATTTTSAIIECIWLALLFINMVNDMDAQLNFLLNILFIINGLWDATKHSNFHINSKILFEFKWCDIIIINSQYANETEKLNSESYNVEWLHLNSKP